MESSRVPMQRGGSFRSHEQLPQSRLHHDSSTAQLSRRTTAGCTRSLSNTQISQNAEISIVMPVFSRRLGLSSVLGEACLEE